MTFFLQGILVVVAAWAGNRIFQRIIDKTVGQHVDEAVDVVVDKIIKASFDMMKAYLAKHTPNEVEIKAKNGDPEAQFILGNMYYFGEDVKQNL